MKERDKMASPGRWFLQKAGRLCAIYFWISMAVAVVSIIVGLASLQGASGMSGLHVPIHAFRVVFIIVAIPFYLGILALISLSTFFVGKWCKQHCDNLSKAQYLGLCGAINQVVMLITLLIIRTVDLLLYGQILHNVILYALAGFSIVITAFIMIGAAKNESA